MLALETGAGKLGLTIDPWGVITSTGLKAPPVEGRSGSMADFRA